MTFKKLFFLIVLFSFSVKAQNIKEKIFVEAGYTHFNRSFADVGAKYLINNNKMLMIGTNALIGSKNGKLLIVPEINATKYFDTKNFLFFTRLNASPKTITPQLGFSGLLAELGVGYGFSMGDSSNYSTKGFRFQLNFNIPLEYKMKLF